MATVLERVTATLEAKAARRAGTFAKEALDPLSIAAATTQVVDVELIAIDGTSFKTTVEKVREALFKRFVEQRMEIERASVVATTLAKAAELLDAEQPTPEGD